MYRTVRAKYQVLVTERTAAESPGMALDAIEQAAMDLLQSVDGDGPQPSSMAIFGDRPELAREPLFLFSRILTDVVFDVLEGHRRRIHALASTLSMRSLAMTSRSTRSISTAGLALRSTRR